MSEGLKDAWKTLGVFTSAFALFALLNELVDIGPNEFFQSLLGFYRAYFSDVLANLFGILPFSLPRWYIDLLVPSSWIGLVWIRSLDKKIDSDLEDPTYFGIHVGLATIFTLGLLNLLYALLVLRAKSPSKIEESHFRAMRGQILWTFILVVVLYGMSKYAA